MTHKIKLDRLTLEDSIGFKKIVGYSLIEGKERVIMELPLTITDDFYLLSCPEETLQDVLNIINSSISKGE